MDLAIRPRADRLLRGAAGSLADLDRAGTRVAGQVLRPGVVRDILSGTWLGHPLHPLLTDVTIGAWTSACALDVLGHDRTNAAATTLIGVGCASAVPAALAGFSDWADLDEEDRRVGVVHAAAVATAAAVYLLSWTARRAGFPALGRALGYAGAAIVSVGGYLGGHLVFARATGVDPTVGDSLPARWTAVAKLAETDVGTLHRVTVKGVPIVLVREDDETVYALHDRCTHRGGPLHKGALLDGCIECPWHGSRFRLTDGAVLRGPATHPEPAFEVRVQEDSIEVRRQR